MKLILTNDNYLIYKFNEQGQPSKWIDLVKLKEAIKTILLIVGMIYISITIEKAIEPYTTFGGF